MAAATSHWRFRRSKAVAAGFVIIFNRFAPYGMRAAMMFKKEQWPVIRRQKAEDRLGFLLPTALWLLASDHRPPTAEL